MQQAHNASSRRYLAPMESPSARRAPSIKSARARKGASRPPRPRGPSHLHHDSKRAPDVPRAAPDTPCMHQIILKRSAHPGTVPDDPHLNAELGPAPVTTLRIVANRGIRPHPDPIRQGPVAAAGHRKELLRPEGLVAAGRGERDKGEAGPEGEEGESVGMGVAARAR